MTSRTPHRTRTAPQKTCSLPKACGLGMLTSLVSSLILLPIATGIAYAQADPVKAALPAALIALYVSVLISGAVTAHKSDNPFFTAGICGGLLLVITLVFALFPIGTADCGFSTPVSVLTHLAVPGTVMLGAFLGRRRPKRATFRHKRRR